MPELARDACLSAPQRFNVRLVGIGMVLPEPAPRAAENARAVRPQPVPRQPVACALAMVTQADGDIDSGTIEWHRQCARDVVMKGDLARAPVDANGDPAFRKSVEAERPQPRFNSLKKSLPLSSMMMNAGKSTTSMRQIASIPSSGYSTTSTFLMQCSARLAAAPPIEPR